MSELNFGINAGLVEELLNQYLENPESVDATWRAYFEKQLGGKRGVTLDALNGKRGSSPGGATTAEARTENGNGTTAENGNGARSNGAALALGREVERAFSRTIVEMPSDDDRSVLARAASQARVYQLLNAYRVRGHFFARINPIEDTVDLEHKRLELGLENFGLSEADLDRPFPTLDLAVDSPPGSLSPVKGNGNGMPKIQLTPEGEPITAPLREIIDHLEETYCRSIGVEYTQLEDPIARRWLQQRMEQTRNRVSLTRNEQLRILTKLTEAEVFEQFVHGSYGAGTKRFSLEGGESMMPLLDLIIERAGDQGVRECVLGMAHRGRLNVLVNLMNKSRREIFAAFEDADARANLGRGDVKYHLGYSTDRVTQTGKQVHLTLTFNPSHLEFVNPVVEGRVRAKQDRRGAAGGTEVMPILIHGDAAFIGQGVVAETLNLVSLEGYSTGGTVHLIVNNQVGFTTNPNESRSTRYASDIVRMLKVPVFHVNGEDPEAVAQVAMLAIDYRQRFQQDVVIDMYCYRKYGHNEGDEPRYTQPKMYKAIDRKPTVRQIYVDELVKLGQVSREQAEAISQEERAELNADFKAVKENGCVVGKYFGAGLWAPYKGGKDADTEEVATNVPKEQLVELANRMMEFPEGFTPHPKVLPTLRQRQERVLSGEPFDWGTGEILAYATLLSQGASVRISGQDVRRGTFSHRHAVLVDSETGASFAPLDRVAQGGAKLRIYNSPLSEAGVLGFEFGYSLDAPDSLVVWEAQFGDFLNGAQVIVDQFLTSCEDKWHRLSGLTLFLPHGYEGQGPEHSSGRLERLLQNSAEDNIQVCNLTTPAQLFHVLRRQVLRPWRKPLVIMTPKSLLRVAATSKGPHRPVSTIDDLANGQFQRVIPDLAENVDPQKVRKVLLCTGKVYYDLAIEREARGLTDVAILRLEQLHPIGPHLAAALAPYKDGTPLVWCQEEPLNYGAWFFINATLPGLLQRFPLSVVSRPRSASPATGSGASHRLEQKELVEQALS